MNGIDGIAGTLGRAVRRRWPLLLVTALLTAALAAGMVHRQAPLYDAQAQLMLKFGREYTYRPEADGLQGWQPSRMVELVNAEVRILGSRAVRTAVLDKFGLVTLYPDLADEALPAAVARERGLDRMDRNLSVRALGDSTVLIAEFRHENPELARNVLAAVIEVYRANRAKAFGGTDTAVAEAQLEWAEGKLAQARDQVSGFRDANDAWLLEADRTAADANVRRLEVEAREATTTAAQQSEFAERLAQELDALQSASARSGPVLNLREQPSAAKLQQVIKETSLLAAIAGRDSPALADLRREEAELYGLVRAAYLGGGTRRGGADDAEQRIDRLLSAWHAANRAAPAAEIRAEQATQALGPLRTELASMQRTQLELDRLVDEEAQATAGYHQARRLAERASTLAVLDARGLDNVVVIDAAEASATPLGLPANARIALGGLLGLVLGVACACLLDARVAA